MTLRRHVISKREHTLNKKNVKILAEVWKIDFPDTLSSSPVSVANGVAYFAAGWRFDSPTGPRFFAVKAATGEIIWERSADILAETINSPQPVVSPRHGLVYFIASYNTQPSTVYALQIPDGTIVWKKDISNIPFTMVLGFPALVDDILIVLLSRTENEFLPPPYSTRGAVLALNALTGEIRWRFETTPEPFAPGGGI